MSYPTHIVAVGGLVEDKNGNVLIAKSSYRKTWEFLGGQVENGENLEEALKREIMEESGVTASVRCLAGVYSNIQQHTWYDGETPITTKVMFDFLCDYESGEPRISNEHTEIMWCPREKLLDYIDHPVYRLRAQNMLNFSGKIAYHAYTSRPFEEKFKRFI